MALRTIPGASVPWGYGHPGWAGGTPNLDTTSLLIDATGEKVAFCGRVFFNERTGTKNITKVGFRFGAVTKAGGSALTVSLQDVSTAAGPPIQPDETQDQTVAIANANASFAANTWLQTGALSATRAVANGDLLAVVIEYDGSGRQGADSVVIAGISPTSSPFGHEAGSTLKTASWAAAAVVPNVILEFDDGTFGTLFGAFPCSNMTNISFNSGSAADEVALEFTFPFPVKIDAVGGMVNPSASCDWDFVVYDGTSAITNGTVSLSSRRIASAVRPAYGKLPDMLTLAANTTYRLSGKPTTANNLSLYYFEVNDANHFQAHVGGTGWRYTTRVDAGSWAAATTTRRPFLWPYVCAFDDAVAAVSAQLINSGGLVG